jgi:hypothetical protein
LRISETYTAPASYRLDGDELVFDRSLGRPRNAVVLPAGWYLTASAIPATVTQLADGRIRLDFWNGRPDAVDVLIKAKRRVTSEDFQKSVTELIDELTQVDSQSPGINSAAIYEGFIADNSPGSFRGGVLGVAPPKVPPQMRELVRLGPAALPELIKHLDDKRPTKLEVGSKPSGSQVGVDSFMFMYFSDEYDPRVPYWFDKAELKRGPSPMEKDFSGRYAMKVADVCYVLIGQIVNRHLLAVRYQPSGGLVVNSPIEATVLAEKVRNDWGNADAETLRQSFLEDINATNYPKRISREEYTDRFVNTALARLRRYFPEAYNALEGDDLKKRKAFEKQATGSRR